MARASLFAICRLRYAASGSGRVSDSVLAKERFCSPQGSSRATCTWDKRRRNFMRAELMTFVVSQVDMCARPLNWSTCVKAGSKASCTASSASATLPRRPRLATSGLLPRRYDSAGAATGKHPQAPGANLPAVRRSQSPSIRRLKRPGCSRERDLTPPPIIIM